MAKEINPKDTSRAMAYELWMKAPNPMVTFFKTMDVTNLIRVSKKRSLKFNMLLDYCIGKAAVSVKEFYTQLIFEIHNLFAKRWLSDAKLLSTLRKVQRFGKSNSVLNLS